MSRIEVEGLDELMKAFGALGEEANHYVESAIHYSNGVLYTSALSKINNRSGDLAKAVFVQPPRVSKSTKKIISGAVGVKKTQKCDYGLHVELGHGISRSKRTGEDHRDNTNISGYVKARPFLRPAADENKEKVINILMIAMTRALREMGGKK